MKSKWVIVLLLLLAGCKPSYEAAKTAEELKLAQPSIDPKTGKTLGLTNDGNLTIPTQGAQQMPQQQQQFRPPQQPLSPAPPTKEAARYPEKPAIPSVSTMTISTSKGDIVIELFPTEAPGSIQNYIEKAKQGFYEGLKFHRVEDWVVQGGDPSGNGTGGGTMPTELSQRAFVEGSVGVARGSNIEVSNDAQFFICTTDCSWLTGKYTLFGKVTQGMDIAQSIAIGDTIQSIVIK